MGGSRRRGITLLVVVLAIGGGLIPFLRRGIRGTSELPVYTIAAERMAAGEEVYRPADRKPFTYPPFFAVPFVPLRGVPLDPPRPAAQVVAWYLVNVAALAAILAIVHRLVRGHAPDRIAAVWIVTGVLAARHLSAVFENQSHDLLVLLLVTLGVAAWCRGRHLAAGLGAGVAAACKATPLLFGWAFLVQRRAAALAGLAAGAAAATLLPDLLFPRAGGGLWVVAWYETCLGGLQPGRTAAGAGAWNASSFLNQSLSGTLHRLLTPSADDPSRFLEDVALLDAGAGAVRAATLGAYAAVLAFLAFACRPSLLRGVTPAERSVRRLGQAGAVACGMVLLSPMSSKSHFCVLLLGIAFCAADFFGRRRDPVLGALLALAFVLGPLTVKGLLGRSAGNFLLAHGTVTWNAVVVLVACGYALHRRAREGGR